MAETSTDVITSMGPFIRNHLVKGHHYTEAALAGMSPMEMHQVHLAQRRGHCHHDMDHTHPTPVAYDLPEPDPMQPAIVLLAEFRDTLPDGHHEKDGLLRAIEVLRHG